MAKKPEVSNVAHNLTTSMNPNVKASTHSTELVW